MNTYSILFHSTRARPVPLALHWSLCSFVPARRSSARLYQLSFQRKKSPTPNCILVVGCTYDHDFSPSGSATTIALPFRYPSHPFEQFRGCYVDGKTSLPMLWDWSPQLPACWEGLFALASSSTAPRGLDWSRQNVLQREYTVYILQYRKVFLGIVGH